MKSRFMKFFGYSSFFWFAFSVSLYLTFPMQALKGKVVTAMEEGLGKGKQGRYGTDPVVQFSSLNLWRFSGFSFERLSLQMGSKDPDPGPTVDFDPGTRTQDNIPDRDQRVKGQSYRVNGQVKVWDGSKFVSSLDVVFIS